MKPESNYPIVRITIENMKYTLLAAMEDQIGNMDEQIKIAIDQACEPERIQQMLNDVSKKEIDKAVTSEIERFFRYGNGMMAIKEAVSKQLERDRDNWERMNE